MALTAFELVTAVGDDAKQTCASVRAGISRVTECSYFFPAGVDAEWDEEEPMRAAMVDGLDPTLSLRSRLVDLAGRVLRPLPSRVSLGRADLRRTALLTALPRVDSVIKGAEIVEKLVPDLLRTCGLPEFPVSQTLAGGHTAVFELLNEARRILDEGEADAVILLAVDSYFAAERLDLLDEAWRLRSARNVDGFTPGEAAAALFLEPLAVGKRKAQAILSPVELAEEPSVISSEKQSTGRALSTVIRRALAGSPSTGPCSWVLCDMNGESYRAFEWGLAMARVPDRLGSVAKLSHPAESLGDVGAATGGVLLGVAATGFARGYAPGGEALVWAASDGPTRAALRVEAPTP